MSSQFKVGDRVKCIQQRTGDSDGDGCLVKDCVYTVESITEYDNLKFSGREHSDYTYRQYRFVLVESRELPLATLLKRAMIGVNALNELSKRFPSEVTVISDTFENRTITDFWELEDGSLQIVKKDIS